MQSQMSQTSLKQDNFPIFFGFSHGEKRYSFENILKGTRKIYFPHVSPIGSAMTLLEKRERTKQI